MNAKYLGLPLVCTTLLAACGGGGPDSGQLEALEARIAAVESAYSNLKSEHDLLSLQVEAIGWGRVAVLKPGDQGYSTFQYDLGFMTARLEDIKPYANGSKVSIVLGNPSAARINGLKARVEWGSVDKDGTPRNDTGKARQVSFPETLSPGTWTKVEVVLEGFPPAELGFVRLREVGHGGIGLRR